MLVFFCVLLGIILKHFEIMLPFSINISLLCTPIFLLGFYGNREGAKCLRISVHSKIVIVAILSCCLYKLANMNGTFHVGDGVCGGVAYLYYINAILGIAITILVASIFTFENKFMLFLSRNTMSIMVFEVYVYAPFKLISQKLLGISFGIQDYMPLWLGLIIALITLVLCAIPCYVINRWFPFFIGKRFYSSGCNNR